MSRAALGLLLAAACAAPPAPVEEIPASRGDVAEALYRQLDEVLARRAEVGGDEGPEAEREREELARLADEIAIRIVRIDPAADVDELARKLEQER